MGVYTRCVNGMVQGHDLFVYHKDLHPFTLSSISDLVRKIYSVLVGNPNSGFSNVLFNDCISIQVL